MRLYTEQTVDLIDAQERHIGQIVIERSEAELVFGKFVPGSDFPAVRQLFLDFEEAVNLQALSVVDELDSAIEALGLRLHLPGGSQQIAVHDVQIWSDGSITCRVSDPAQSPGDRSLEATQSIQAAGGSNRLTSR